MQSTKQVKQNSPPVLDNSPSGVKKKGKQNYETEPMVLMAVDAPENIAQYSIDIPSVDKDRVLDEMDKLKNITVHLNQIVQTMEHVYEKDDKIKEESKKDEEISPHEREDMVCFLIFCSQLSSQLDVAVHEEKLILESLLKWFETEVQILEELGEEEIIPDWQVPVADKNITDNINKLMNRIQRLEELKGRVQELPRFIRTPTPREKRRPLGQPPAAMKDPKFILDELAMKHTTEDVMNMVRVFQDDSGAPQTIESMNNRMVEIMKIFERQTNKLHRVENEQDVLEGKFLKIQHDFRKLAEEKQIMEDEFQKMRTSETNIEKVTADTRKKLLAKLEKEKAKVEEKTGAQPEKGKRPLSPQKAKEAEATRMKVELAKAQANIETLEREKKMLENKLQKVLEEADMTRDQLAEIPPDIPDLEFTYTALEESEKDLSKKSKKGTRLKGKASIVDASVQKVTKLDTVKAGETFPGKGQEISTAPQAKEGKGKKKGTDLSEIERRSSVVSGKLPKQPGISETPSKTDAKGVKPRKSVELKKQHSAVKGTGKEPDGSADTADTVLPQLPPDQEKQLLPDSTDQQAESVEITSEKQREMLPAIISSTEFQEEETSPLPRTPLSIWADSTEPEEDELKDLIDEGMLQLMDHLTELKGMPEAETLAKFLLEPRKSMEVLSSAQKLQLINQLISPEEQQQTQFPIPVEESQIIEQQETKRRILANIASTLNLLDQTQAEAGQTEEEVNETAKIRKILFADLESNLKDLQQAQAVVSTEQDLENKINELTKKRSLLTSALESNLINLKEAQAIAATQPSEMSKNKVKELLQERAALTACQEENERELQQAKSQEALFLEKVKHEEEVNELSEKRTMLLSELEKNLNDLQEAQTLAAIEPSSENDEKIKELMEQRELLAASQDANLQDLERAQAYVPRLEESRLKQEEINELSEKRRSLLDSLKSNLKDLQEAQALVAIEPSAMNDEKVKELTEQRKLLTASLETNLQDLRGAQGYVSSPDEESRLNELKLNELIEERKSLTTELDAAVQVLQGIQHQKELNELSQKKQLLLKDLESNLKDIKEAQAIATAEPGSITEHKLQELTEQRRHLAADLDATLHHIEELHHQDEIAKTPEVKLQELSDKKQLLLEKLESTLKELQEVQALASAEAGGVSEQKIQELTEQKRQLTAELESAIFDMQEIQLQDEILKSTENEVQKLLEKKQLLLENLVSTLKELHEAQATEAAHPGSISEDKLQVLRARGRRLTGNLDAIAHDIKKAQLRATGRVEQVTPTEQELRDLFERKQFLLQNLTSNLKELEQVQALAGSEPDSFTENQIQQLNEQRKFLGASLDSVIRQIKEIEDGRVSETPKLPVALNMDLDKLAQHKTLLLENLESNLKDLQEAQTLAATHPGSISEQKVQELTEDRKLLAAGLEAIIEDIGNIERQTLDKDAVMRTREIILEELYHKEQSILENLESNWKNLQQAEALAAAHPGGVGENRIKKLTEQRKLLASRLESVMQDIQEVEGLDREKLEILEIIEAGLAELSENRKQLWRNVELNLNDLKDLQDLALSEPDGMQEERKQMLAEQKKNLAANLEALVQDIEEEQNVLSRGQMTSPDGRNLNDLFEIKNLELKLDEILQMKALSDTQMDSMKGKLCKLKAKSGLDRLDKSLQEPLSLTKEELAVYVLDDEAAGKLFGEKRCWSPYLQKSIRDLQQKSIKDLQQKSSRYLQQKKMVLKESISGTELCKPIEKKTSLEECLVSIPLKILEDDTIDKYGPSKQASWDDQLAKRRALATKLEANMKDLQALREAEQMRRAREKLAPEISSEVLKPIKSSLKLHISKVPEIKKRILWQDSSMIVPTIPEVESETPIQSHASNLQKKDTELELRKHIMQQAKRTSLPYDLTIQKRDLYNAMQEILDSNKGLLPAHKANLPHALARAQSQLQQANLIAVQKLLCSQPTVPNTARFYDYSLQPPRPAWEGSQLPATNYLQKLIALKKKLLSPELKGLLEISPSTVPTSKSAATVQKMDSMLICGKGFRGSRHELSPTTSQLRNN